MTSPDDDTWKNWKRVAPALYDFLANHHLVWPALACRFGPRRNIEPGSYQQTVYVSEQTAKEAKTPNKLVAHSLRVADKGTAPIDHVSSWKENQKSPYVGSKPEKTIHHMGECNKIRDIPGFDNFVATHSDVSDVYIWDLNTQPDVSQQKKDKGKINTPDLKLTGHTDVAPFALATSTMSPSVCSGGDDMMVLLWNLYDSTVLTRSGSSQGTLMARSKLAGHTNTVTDVCFKPGTDNLVASCADDHSVLTWDSRQAGPTMKVDLAHGEHDILCIDWCMFDDIIGTGDQRGEFRVWDRRMMVNASGAASPLHCLSTQGNNSEDVNSGVLIVEWSPTSRGWVASGGDDGRVSVWDIGRPVMDEADRLPSQLVLQHLGHLGTIMDLQWSPSDPYTLLSVSNDGFTFKEGGALQMWRMADLITMPMEATKTELEVYTDWLVSGKMGDLQKAVRPVQRVEVQDAPPEEVAAEPVVVAEEEVPVAVVSPVPAVEADLVEQGVQEVEVVDPVADAEGGQHVAVVEGVVVDGAAAMNTE